MYDPFAPRVNGKPAVSWLSVREPKIHAQIKKPIASAYSLSVLKEYESLVDDMILKFMNRLQGLGTTQDARFCDMAVWLRLCMFPVYDHRATLMFSDAHDVIMHLTFSDTLGFIATGGDIDNFLFDLDRNLDRAGLVEALTNEAMGFANVKLS